MSDLGNHAKAIACHGEAISLDGTNPRNHFNLAIALYDAGDRSAAADAYRAAIAVDDKFIPARQGLAGVLRELGDSEGAIACYRDILKIEPKHGTAIHMLASLTGSGLAAPPVDYVSELFDNFAPRFDDHMHNRLGYVTPRLCRALTDRLRPSQDIFSSGVDLGCGTGLAGEQFRDITGFLCGIDVSREMVAKAREKNIYDETEIAEICAFLETTVRRFDLFVAADVVVYFGDLSRLLRAIAQAANSQALVVFSTEKYDGSGYVLRDTGRYAHAPGHVVDQSRELGFSVLAQQDAVIREQNGEPVAGQLFALSCTDI